MWGFPETLSLPSSLFVESRIHEFVERDRIQASAILGPPRQITVSRQELFHQSPITQTFQQLPEKKLSITSTTLLRKSVHYQDAQDTGHVRASAAVPHVATVH